MQSPPAAVQYMHAFTQLVICSSQHTEPNFESYYQDIMRSLHKHDIITHVFFNITKHYHMSDLIYAWCHCTAWHQLTQYRAKLCTRLRTRHSYPWVANVGYQKGIKGGLSPLIHPPTMDLLGTSPQSNPSPPINSSSQSIIRVYTNNKGRYLIKDKG